MKSDRGQLDHLPPPLLVRVWRAKRRYFATGTLERLTFHLLQRELQKDNLEPHSLSAISRLRDKYRAYPSAEHPWFPWPMERDTEAPFPIDLSSEPVDPKSEDRLELLRPDGSVVEAAANRDSGVIRLVRPASGMVAAGITSFYVLYTLDFLSDGVADHVVRMCQLFAHIALPLTTY